MPNPRNRITPKRLRPLCGAQCRDGSSCVARATWDYSLDRARNGRCKNHGGMTPRPRVMGGV